MRLEGNDKGSFISVSKSQQKKDPAVSSKGRFSPITFVVGGVVDVGFAILVPMLGGTFLGVYLDKRYSTNPKFTIALLLLGLILGLINVFRLVSKLMKEQN